MSRKLAVITGGTSGIGFGIAKKLAPQCDLALGYGSNEQKAHMAKSELKGMFPQLKLKIYKGMLREYQDCQKFFEKIHDDFITAPSILINCAGRIDDQLFLKSKFTDHLQLLNELLVVPMALGHLFLKDMYRAKFGRIINMSSISAHSMAPGQVYYAAAKSGIEGFTKNLALEVARRGITVNAIAPGLIVTPMTGQLVDTMVQHNKNAFAGIPANYPGLPEDVAGLVEFLCSDSARYITGQVILVDGGKSLVRV